MATIANLNILLTMDDQANKGLEKSRKNLQQWGASLQKVGAGMSAAITAPVVAFTMAAVSAASDQAEAMSAVEQVYGSAANTVVQRSLEAAQAVGMSTAEYLQTSAVLGVYGDVLGGTAAQTAEFSNSLITAASDLGSFYNANTTEVLTAMQAALRGEFDPLERFGIMMNQAALEQYALENGISDGSTALTAQQRILAAQGFIMDNMGKATGDFARTSDGLANRQKILKAQLANVSAQLGTVLLPAITRVVAVFSELLTRFQNLNPSWQRWAVLIALAAAAVGPFLIVLGTLLTVLPAIGAALAVLIGPIGLVIAAIALLTAAYIGNWWGFRDAVNGVAASVKTFYDRMSEIDAIRTTVTSAIDAVVGSFQRLFDGVEKIGKALLNGDWRTALAGIGDVLSIPQKAVGEFIKGIETGFAPLDSLLNGVGNMFTDYGRIIQEIFQGDWSGAIDVAKRMLDRLPEIGRNVLDMLTMIPWGEVGTAILNAFTAIPGLIENAGTILYDKGVELLTGLIDGVGSALPGLTALLGVLWSVAQTAVGDLGATLLEKGESLILGMIDGIGAKLADFMALLRAVPNTAVTAVGNLAGTLYDAGANLIGGLIGGINSMIDGLKSTLSRITGWIPDWKGPAERDAVLLFGNGALIMQGLIGGIESQVPSLERSLSGITTDVEAIMSAQFASGAVSATRINGGFGSDRIDRQGNVNAANYGTIINEAPRYPNDPFNSTALARSRG